MVKTEAFIFDLDGTLLNSLEDLANSMNEVLMQYDKKTYPLKAYKQFVGNGIYKLVERACRERNLDPDLAYKDFQEVYASRFKENSYPYPQVLEGLTRLNELKVPIAILTNKEQKFTNELIIEFFGGIDFIEVIGDLKDGKKKPNPHYALDIAHKMKIEPNRIAFVGDSDVDMQTARRAGMKAIAVSWGFRDSNELLNNGADVLIHNFLDILKEVR